MTDDTDNGTDGLLQPSVRRVGVLSRRDAGPTAGRPGVLEPFTGLLSGGRRPRSGRPEVSLSYLTLEPLVVAGLAGDDEGTADGRPSSGRDDGPRGAERAPTEDATADGTHERLTVREYIRERTVESMRETDDAGERRAPDRADSPGTGMDDGDRRPAPGRGDEGPSPGDLTPPRETPRTVVERWRRPPLVTDRRPAPGRDDHESVASPDPGGRVPDPADTSPDLAVSRTRSVRDSVGRPGPERSGGQSARSGPTGRSDDGPGRAGTGDGRPRLVVRESVPAGETGGTAEGSSRPGERAGTVAESNRPGERAGRDGPTAPPRVGSREPQTERPGGSGPDAGGDGSVLAFDSVEDPAFDRFVETLSRRLERRERIERERRGL